MDQQQPYTVATLSSTSRTTARKIRPASSSCSRPSAHRVASSCQAAMSSRPWRVRGARATSSQTSASPTLPARPCAQTKVYVPKALNDVRFFDPSNADHFFMATKFASDLRGQNAPQLLRHVWPYGTCSSVCSLPLRACARLSVPTTSARRWRSGTTGPTWSRVSTPTTRAT